MASRVSCRSASTSHGSTMGCTETRARSGSSPASRRAPRRGRSAIAPPARGLGNAAGPANRRNRLAEARKRLVDRSRSKGIAARSLRSQRARESANCAACRPGFSRGHNWQSSRANAYASACVPRPWAPYGRRFPYNRLLFVAGNEVARNFPFDTTFVYTRSVSTLPCVLRAAALIGASRILRQPSSSQSGGDAKADTLRRLALAPPNRLRIRSASSTCCTTRVAPHCVFVATPTNQ